MSSQRARAVEKAARKAISDDLAHWWDPGIGHFIGLNAFDPADWNRPFEPGMTFTIEPRIYIRDEKLGVMIEDDVLRAQVLRESSRKLKPPCVRINKLKRDV